MARPNSLVGAGVPIVNVPINNYTLVSKCPNSSPLFPLNAITSRSVQFRPQSQLYHTIEAAAAASTHDDDIHSLLQV